MSMNKEMQEYLEEKGLQNDRTFTEVPSTKVKSIKSKECQDRIKDYLQMDVKNTSNISGPNQTDFLESMETKGDLTAESLKQELEDRKEKLKPANSSPFDRYGPTLQGYIVLE